MTQEVKFRTIKVSEKGQVAIPVEIQREMGIGKGDELLLIKKGEKIILEKPKKLARFLRDEFEDVQKVSESSLNKVWLNKKDEVWNRYLKGNAKK
jgi:AbrB family looped-hinge helix DNA binding protein